MKAAHLVKRRELQGGDSSGHKLDGQSPGGLPVLGKCPPVALNLAAADLPPQARNDVGLSLQESLSRPLQIT